jgi:hypothetical protein
MSSTEMGRAHDEPPELSSAGARVFVDAALKGSNGLTLSAPERCLAFLSISSLLRNSKRDRARQTKARCLFSKSPSIVCRSARALVSSSASPRSCASDFSEICKRERDSTRRPWAQGSSSRGKHGLRQNDRKSPRYLGEKVMYLQTLPRCGEPRVESDITLDVMVRPRSAVWRLGLIRLMSVSARVPAALDESRRRDGNHSTRQYRYLLSE